MAREMTPQERAAVTRLYEKILSYSPDKEAMEAGDDKDFEAIRQALAEIRRAALLEAANIAFDHACDDPQWCTCNSVIYRELTRLAQEG